MPLSSREDSRQPSKLPSDVSKSLQKLIKLARCHGPCGHLRTLSSSSSPDHDRSLYSCDLDDEQVVMLEIIESRALMATMMKAKKTIQPRDQLVFSAWAAPPPAPGRLLHGASTEKTDDGEEEYREVDGEDDGTESDAFFTVKSCLSRCSSSDTTGRQSKFELRGSSVLEGFRHCRGWPFGLYRKALLLPPLPSSPADSWMWHNGNLSRQ